MYACSSSSSGDSPPANNEQQGDATTDGNTNGGDTKGDAGDSGADVDVAPAQNPIEGAVAESVDGFPSIYGLIWNGDSLYFSSPDLTDTTTKPATPTPVVIRYKPGSNLDGNGYPTAWYVDTTSVATKSFYPLGIANDEKGNLLFVSSPADTSGTLRHVAAGSATMPVAVGNVSAMTLTFTTPPPGRATWYSPKNAVVRASDGTIYVTDPGYQWAQDPLNAIYRVTPGNPNTTGTVTTIDTFPGGDRPNGIALSPKADILYVSLTENQPSIVKYAVKDDGTVDSNSKTTFGTLLPAGSQPDGLAVDTAGNVYVAMKEAVQVFAPDGTQWAGTITLPAGVAATTVAFGGSEGTTLYIGTDTGGGNFSGLYTATVKVKGL